MPNDQTSIPMPPQPHAEPRMKETAADQRVKDSVYKATADELRQFIERAETLAAEKRDIAEQEKEVFAEAKGRGYDTKAMRKIIALRRRKPDDIAEEQAVLDLYLAALGMA
jgi:uncharacterized protein (UPF0335 family)